MQTFLLTVFILSAAAFVIQTVMGLVGVSDDIDSGDGIFGFFTVRNVIAFLLGFSAAGYLMLRSGYASFAAITAGIMFGIFLSGCMFLLMRALIKLQQESSVSPRDYSGLFASVTVRIAANRKSKGKVELIINERLEEMAAVTDNGEYIAKGMRVQIVRRLEDGFLLVKRVTE
ncbi:MAG: hypothetical protein LBH05_01690 [Deferribacteraceae bacterium]|jgi:hypothetical protein|nr:hypothetical protein [Deferribacteraceae bacterium]